ncbi:hypothetical protein ACEPAI_3567 [Sanghuangporus weigelae]
MSRLETTEVLKNSDEAIKTWDKPLDYSLYNPDEEEKMFFKKETGIEDDEQLREYIIAVQTKAYTIHQYPCIRVYEFMRLKLARLPAYPKLIKLGGLLLLVCCVGNDCRKAAQDGYPIQSILATDLRRTLWDIGHEMFRSTPETFPVPFIEGDVLDPSFFLDTFPPVMSEGTTMVPSARQPVSLDRVKNLNELRGGVSAIFAGAFFHLFTEVNQERIARGLAGLLSPSPGSMLLVVHGGKTTKGFGVQEVADSRCFAILQRPGKHFGKEYLGQTESKSKLTSDQR